MPATTAAAPIRYDYQGTLLDGTGIGENDLSDLGGRLEEARREVLETDSKLYTSGEIPAEKIHSMPLSLTCPSAYSRNMSPNGTPVSWGKFSPLPSGLVSQLIGLSCWGSVDRTWGCER